MEPDRDPLRRERERMVNEQILRRGIRDVRVLEAIREVPRHRFVPEADRGAAYDDGPLPVGYQQTISQPYIVAYMTEMLQLSSGDRVLEIGTGTGYQTAVLAKLAAEVYTVEIVEPLGSAARMLLQQLGYRNIHFKIGNGWNAWPEAAPFDKVIVTAVAPEVPPALIDQLKDGGRLVMPVGSQVQELIEGVKRHGILEKTRQIPVRFVPLISPGEEKE